MGACLRANWPILACTARCCAMWHTKPPTASKPKSSPGCYSSSLCNPALAAAASSLAAAEIPQVTGLLLPALSDRNGDNAFSSLAVSPQVTNKIASAIDHSEKPGRHPKQGPPFFHRKET